MQSIDDILKLLEALRQATADSYEAAFLELGLGSIDYRLFSTDRVVYTTVPFLDDGHNAFQYQPIQWVKERNVPSSPEAWKNAKAAIGSQTIEYLDKIEAQDCAKKMLAIAEFWTSKQPHHIEEKFHGLMHVGYLSDKTRLEALPEFYWRLIIGPRHDK